MSDQPESPILLRLYEDGVIAFDQWVEISSETEVGIAAKRQDGSDEFYVTLAAPSYAECFGIEVSEYSSFEALRRATVEAGGWDDGEPLPWCELDENSEISPETDTFERLLSWIKSPVGSDGGSDWALGLMERWFDHISIYAPGLQIYAALSASELCDLSMAFTYLGSPGGSFPCVSSQASLDKLNEAMRLRGLPFLFVGQSPTSPE